MKFTDGNWLVRKGLSSTVRLRYTVWRKNRIRCQFLLPAGRFATGETPWKAAFVHQADGSHGRRNTS